MEASRLLGAVALAKAFGAWALSMARPAIAHRRYGLL